MPQTSETAKSTGGRPAKVRKTLLKRVLAGLAAAVVVAVAGLMLTFTAAKLELPQVDVGALPPASPPPEMSISALGTGTYEARAALAYRGGSWADVRHFAATGVLVRHPRGNLLIDTGFGRHLDEHLTLIPSIQRSPHVRGVPAVEQLATGNIHAVDIAGIIPTHAHWDHISGVDDFPGVPVMVSAAARRFIDSRAKGTEVLNSFHDVNYRQYEFESGPYLGFPSSHDVWGDGSIVIVPAPAHTPDSVVVFVNLPSGTRYAFVGDLVWQLDGLAIPAEKPWMLRRLIGENDDEVHSDIARVRSAIRRYPQIHAVPAHDSSSFHAIPAFPASAR